MNTPRVWLATTKDVPGLLPVVEAYWQFEAIRGFAPGRVAAALETLLAEPALGAGWFAVADGAAVGYLLAVYVFSLEHSGLTAEIDEFFVLPSHRGRGLGAELLRVAEAAFARRGCTNVSLQLSRRNDAGRAFYRARGYVERSGYDLLEKVLPGGASA